MRSGENAIKIEVYNVGTAIGIIQKKKQPQNDDASRIRTCALKEEQISNLSL